MWFLPVGCAEVEKRDRQSEENKKASQFAFISFETVPLDKIALHTPPTSSRKGQVTVLEEAMRSTYIGNDEKLL